MEQGGTVWTCSHDQVKSRSLCHGLTVLLYEASPWDTPSDRERLSNYQYASRRVSRFLKARCPGIIRGSFGRLYRSIKTGMLAYVTACSTPWDHWKRISDLVHFIYFLIYLANKINTVSSVEYLKYVFITKIIHLSVSTKYQLEYFFIIRAVQRVLFDACCDLTFSEWMANRYRYINELALFY